MFNNICQTFKLYYEEYEENTFKMTAVYITLYKTRSSHLIIGDKIAVNLN